jgi:hypothetical protein
MKRQLLPLAALAVAMGTTTGRAGSANAQAPERQIQALDDQIARYERYLEGILQDLKRAEQRKEELQRRSRQHPNEIGLSSAISSNGRRMISLTSLRVQAQVRLAGLVRQKLRAASALPAARQLQLIDQELNRLRMRNSRYPATRTMDFGLTLELTGLRARLR